MPVTIFAMPKPVSPFQSLMGGVNAAQQIYNNQLNAKKAQLFNQYLPQEENAKMALLKAQTQAQNTQNLWYGPQEQAKIALLREQANQAVQPKPFSPFGKAVADYNNFLKTYGPNDPRTQGAKNFLGKLTSQNGITFSTNPDGTFNFSTGTQNGPNPFKVNIVKDPRFGPSKSGAGGTYYTTDANGKTKAMSSPTGTSTNLEQASLIGIERTSPILERLWQEQAPFQTFSGDAQEHGEGLSNYFFGTNYMLPSQKAAAQGEIETAPEGLLRAYGLRPSEYALTTMKNSIMPRFGESKEGFKSRLSHTLAHLKRMQTDADLHLREGFDVTPSNEKNESQQTYIPKNKNDPLGIR